MDTIDRLHHICLTVSSEDLEEGWPRVHNFYTDFLGMNSYRVPTEEMDHEIGLDSMEEGMEVGRQEIVEYDEQGRPRTEYFHYLAGEDMSETACLVDIICYLTKPGQFTQPLTNMNDLGLRGMTLLVDNIDAIYERAVEQGVVTLGEPTSQDWGDLGEVRFVVVKDPAGNPVELVQTNEISSPGDGKVLRIYSINQNTAHLDKMLDFYHEAGMTLVARVEHESVEYGAGMGFAGSAKATTCYLKGANPEAKTYFAITQWSDPVSQAQILEEGHTPAYYRMWHWIKGDAAGVERMFDKMRPKMARVAQEPFRVVSPKPWDDVTMSFFLNDDEVHQEFANHINDSWKGLQVLVGVDGYDHNFHTKYE